MNADYYSLNKEPQIVPRGGIKYNWNPKTRKFDLAWKTGVGFTTSIPVADDNDTLYAIGLRNRTYTRKRWTGIRETEVFLQSG